MQLVKSFLISCLMCIYICADQTIEIDRSVAHNHRVPLLIGIATGNQNLKEVASVIQKDFTWSGQCAVTVVEQSAPKKIHEMREIFSNGYTFALFLTAVPHGIEWRLYDVLQMTMLQGKRTEHKNGHMIAHEVWHELLGGKSPFLTQLAYIKKEGHHAYSRWQLCTSTPNGLQESVILNSKKVLVAPTWGKNIERPTLIFSEFTQQNVRLLGTDLEGHKWSVVDKDGTSVGISFSSCTDDVVYCRSGQIWSYRFDHVSHMGLHRLVVREADVCVCPTLCANGDIVYGTRGKIRKYCVASNKSFDITTHGYCVAPSYTEQKRIIVYSKRIGNVMQLYTCDTMGNKHEQLTTGVGDKIDACWSPCGNFIVYCHEEGKRSRIAVFVCATRESFFVTADTLYCSYPSWSPVFDKNGNIS